MYFAVLSTNTIKNVTFPNRMKVKRDTVLIPPHQPQRWHNNDINMLLILSRNGPRTQPISPIIIRGERHRSVAPHANEPQSAPSCIDELKFCVDGG